MLAFAPLVLFEISKPEPIGLHFGQFVDSVYEVLCIALAFAGLAVRIMTVGFVPARTSGRNTRNQIAETLNQTGMYSLTRNPLYLGNAITIMGIAMFTQSLMISLVMLLFLIIYLERIIAAEEQFLVDRFGDVYLEWAKRVPAFIPRPSGWVRPQLSFSMRTVLKREHSSMLSIMVTLFALDQIREWLTSSAPTLDLDWIASLAVATIVYITLVALKKWTTILDVAGR